MLIFNGQRFAETPNECAPDVQGMAKRFARRIDLYCPLGRLRGCITGNGIVATATPQPDGRTFYSYGWPRLAGPEPRLSEQRDMVEGIATRRRFNFSRGETDYWFKGEAR